MLAFIFLNSRMRFLFLFFNTFLWIPLFSLTQAILAAASLFCRHPELHYSNAGTLLVKSYHDDDRAAEEEICSICLTEFVREDSIGELPDCAHVFHLNCIEKWLDRNRYTCPLCRCFFNIEKKKERNDHHFLVPDNPSCLYYFLQ